MSWVSIDDVLREAEDERESRLDRPSPYVVPPTRKLEELGCWVYGCDRTFETRRRLNAHLIDDHGSGG